MQELTIKYQDTDKIIPYEDNPRDNEDGVAELVKSIKAYGFNNPIIVDENNIIINGHTRLKASVELGLEQVPTIVLTNLSDSQKTAYRIADNKLGELSEWDSDLLLQEFEKLQAEGEEIIGFTEFEVQELLDKVEFNVMQDLDDYIDPSTEAPKEKYLTCPHCGNTAPEKDYKKENGN